MDGGVGRRGTAGYAPDEWMAVSAAAGPPHMHPTTRIRPIGVYSHPARLRPFAPRMDDVAAVHETANQSWGESTGEAEHGRAVGR